jgi:hypothetical protein
VLWDVCTLCAVAPPRGLYGVVGTGVLWDVSTLCAVVHPPGLYGVVVTGCGVSVHGVCCGTSSWMVRGAYFLISDLVGGAQELMHQPCLALSSGETTHLLVQRRHHLGQRVRELVARQLARRVERRVQVDGFLLTRLGHFPVEAAGEPGWVRECRERVRAQQLMTMEKQ